MTYGVEKKVAAVSGTKAKMGVVSKRVVKKAPKSVTKVAQPQKKVRI